VEERIVNKDISYIEKLLEYYGEFIPVPVELLVNPRYNGGGDNNRVSQSSAILYGVLSIISKKENEKDENGLYVTLTGEQIADIIGTTTGETVRKKIEELEKFNLIERGQIKQGQPYKLYIKEIKR
jgi:hypothetical protein